MVFLASGTLPQVRNCDPRNQVSHRGSLVYIQGHMQAPVDDTSALICKVLGLYVGNNLVSTLASKREREGNSLIASALGGEK